MSYPKVRPSRELGPQRAKFYRKQSLLFSYEFNYELVHDLNRPKLEGSKVKPSISTARII